MVMQKQVVVSFAWLGFALSIVGLATIAGVIVGSVALDSTIDQKLRNDKQDIIEVMNCFSAGMSQKDITAFTTYMTDYAYVDFSAVGAPMPGPVDQWIPFQQFIWEFYVQTQTTMFPSPCITMIGGVNATAVAAFSATQSSYAVEMPGDARLPGLITASTAEFLLFKTPTGWKITSMIVQPNATVIGVAPSLSGVIDPQVKRQARTTLTAEELERKHYFEIIIGYYEQIQRPDLVAIVQLSPEYIRLFSP